MFGFAWIHFDRMELVMQLLLTELLKEQKEHV